MSATDSSEYYVYILLDTRKPGRYVYGKHEFNFEPFYVGKGKGKRYLTTVQPHRSGGENNMKIRVYRKIQAAGLKAKGRFIRKDITQEQAFRLEKRLINLIGRRDKGEGPLANLTNGGEGGGGMKFSAEERKRRSERAKKIIWTEERRAKLRAARAKQVCSDETRRKMSETRKGRKHSAEWCENISNAQKGRKLSEKNKKNISKALTGRTLSAEHRERIRQGMLRYRNTA